MSSTVVHSHQQSAEMAELTGSVCITWHSVQHSSTTNSDRHWKRCQTLSLSVNPTKCEIVLFTRHYELNCMLDHVKIFLSCALITKQNIVTVSHTACVCVRSQKFLGMLEPGHLWIGCSWSSRNPACYCATFGCSRSNGTRVITEICQKTDPSHPIFQGNSRSSELTRINQPPIRSKTADFVNLLNTNDPQ